MATLRRKAASSQDDFDPDTFQNDMELTAVHGDSTLVRFHFDHIGPDASTRFSHFAVDLTLDDLARCITKFADMKRKQ